MNKATIDGRMLVAHHDIQSWVSSHNGMPAMHRVPNQFGGAKAQLSLRFRGPEAPELMPTIDDGSAPCSWNAWLAELDRQELAVRITSPQGPDYQLVPRSGRAN